MVASTATVVSVSALASLLLLLGSASSSVAHQWVCPEVSIQENITMQHILGHWFLLELDAGPSVNPNNTCLKLSLTNLREESSNVSSVDLAMYTDRGNGYIDLKLNYSAHFVKENPVELVSAGERNTLWRVHSLSSDGNVLVMAVCTANRDLYWMTLGVADDSLPVDLPRRSAHSVRSDPNFCRQLMGTIR